MVKVGHHAALAGGVCVCVYMYMYGSAQRVQSSQGVIHMRLNFICQTKVASLYTETKVSKKYAQ